MKTVLKKVGDGSGDVFDVLIENASNFYPYWHYHPQYEIMLITESTGTRYVGDSITSFQEGDITIMGSNIPHLFRNDIEYFNEKTEKVAKAIVIYFSDNFVNSDFFSLREMTSISEFLNLSKKGILIQERTRPEITQRLHKIVNEDGVTRLMDFISLLHYIASESDYRVLSSLGFANMFEQQELSKLNKIFDYLLNNFQNTITLEEVSKVSNMSTTNFCKYFKSHTNKTLITFLNEIRIGYACKLLIEKREMSISEICFECGFNNLTNFNIQFKRMKNMSPTIYRETYNLYGLD